MFIYSSHGKWAFPLSCGVFLPSPLLQAFPLLVAGRVPLFLPSLASLFICSSMRDCPSPLLRCSGRPSLLATCLFFFFCQLLVYYSVCFFSLGGGSVCPGGYADLAHVCLWEYCVPLSSPGGLLLPSRLGTGIWWCRSPPGFSVYRGVGVLCAGWGCGDVGVLPLLGGFSCKVFSSISPRFYFRKHAFCFLHLVAIFM
jgi:hypothetical protein